jgi:hypothetical protein
MTKSRITGIDALFKNTGTVSKAGSEKPDGPLVMINFQASASLKKKINMYCIENEISMKDFLTELITTHLNKE